MRRFFQHTAPAHWTSADVDTALQRIVIDSARVEFWRLVDHDEDNGVDWHRSILYRLKKRGWWRQVKRHIKQYPRLHMRGSSK